VIKIKRSQIDIICEILLFLSKNYLGITKISYELNLEYAKLQSYLEYLEKLKLIKCYKKINKYHPSYKKKKPFFRLSQNVSLSEQGYYTRFFYKTTKKGEKVVKSWLIIKNAIIPKKEKFAECVIIED